MRTMPRLWRTLALDLALDHGLSWRLWTALGRARWSVSVEWREAVLAFARRDAWTSAEDVEVFFRQRVTLPQLMAVVEALRQEGAMGTRDARRLEEHLLERANAQGEWKHLPGQAGNL
jgi:hypothetical protein